MKIIEIIEAIEAAQSIDDLENICASMKEAHEINDLNIDDNEWPIVSQSLQAKMHEFSSMDKL